MNEEFMKRLTVAVAETFPVSEGETFDDFMTRAAKEPLGRRVMIVAEIDGISRGFTAERQVNKRAWIAAARLAFSPGPRRPCFVCSKFQYVCEAHHVTPLNEQFERKFLTANQEHAWLCPTHHAIVHLMIDGRKDPPLASVLFVDHTPAEIDILVDLARKAERRP